MKQRMGCEVQLSKLSTMTYKHNKLGQTDPVFG